MELGNWLKMGRRPMETCYKTRYKISRKDNRAAYAGKCEQYQKENVNEKYGQRLSENLKKILDADKQYSEK